MRVWGPPVGHAVGTDTAANLSPMLDAATRNVLLASDLKCKLSDFGMVRERQRAAPQGVSPAADIHMDWTRRESKTGGTRMKLTTGRVQDSCLCDGERRRGGAAGSPLLKAGQPWVRKQER